MRRFILCTRYFERHLRALVYTSAFFNPRAAEGFTGASALRDAHAMLTRLIAQSANPDWAWGGVDFWVRTDEFIARKRRGEIEGRVTLFCSMSSMY
jgi:hypothetical protein